MTLFKLMHVPKLLNAVLIAALTLISGCSTQNTATAPNAANKATIANPMPGDAEFYGFGISQTKEDLENIEIAQYALGLYKTRRSWDRVTVGRGANTLGLRTYYPVDMRWKLKDGREFILEDIDTATIMREYFKTNNFLLQHQREKRKEVLGDYSPALQFGVKDDTVVIKWGLTLNKTPVDKRFPVIVNGIPARDGTMWKLEYEEHFVIALKGKPTSGIDFNKTEEFLK
jgi:hypothetical protein